MDAVLPGGPRRVVVVGGGVAGLAAASRLLEQDAGLDVVLLEGSTRLGGVVSTRTRDGFLLEGGPDSFLTDRPWAVDLCRRLGLEEDLIPTSAAGRGLFVVRGGRLLRMPDGFALLAPARVLPFLASPLLSLPGRLRVVGEVLVRSRSEGDESVGAFVRRRLGGEVLEHVVEPLVSGMYGADPDELSLRATFPRFLELERRHGSVVRGLRAGRRRSAEEAASGPRYGLFAAPRRGMQRLVDALADRVGARARTGVEATFVAAQGGGWAVRASNGETIVATDVVLAVQAYAAAALARGLDGSLADLLAGIPYASSSLVNAAFRRRDVSARLGGFGFVVPAREQRRLKACTFSSVKFEGRAPEDGVLLRGFFPGTGEDGELVGALRSELRGLLGIEAEPLFVDVHRHPRALAQYPVGHLERLEAIERRLALHPGLRLAGTCYVGGGIPGAIRSGELAADRILGSA